MPVVKCQVEFVLVGTDERAQFAISNSTELAHLRAQLSSSLGIDVSAQLQIREKDPDKGPIVPDL